MKVSLTDSAILLQERRSVLHVSSSFLHVSSRQQVRDPASHRQFATTMFVCGHPRHNAQGIIRHINLNIIMPTKFMTSKQLPSSLTGNIRERDYNAMREVSYILCKRQFYVKDERRVLSNGCFALDSVV